MKNSAPAGHRHRGAWISLALVGGTLLAGCTDAGHLVASCRAERLPEAGARLAWWNRTDFFLVAIREIRADLSYAGRDPNGALTFEVQERRDAVTFNASGRALPLHASRQVARHSLVAEQGATLPAATLGGPYNIAMHDPTPDGEPRIVLEPRAGCQAVTTDTRQPATGAPGEAIGPAPRRGRAASRG